MIVGKGGRYRKARHGMIEINRDE